MPIVTMSLAAAIFDTLIDAVAIMFIASDAAAPDDTPMPLTP